ncbi:PIR Superfamily Protein [Plasmodium ovale wallikeri]|uniref:PIR Superfamily Protein n=1 Tax=Plasmodium ovale wallikeri TaxID=864142 RepID=A0A1A9AIC2_PLAOA|nr:PIR Superfamily Protein [Plasmodium ovale wallikeri]SBT56676.1 PIR Superfamily Protein [Plasmodium ovale wallikeri]
MSDNKSDIYSFFKEFEKYKDYEAEMNHLFPTDKHRNKCYSFLTDIEKFGTENANDVCVKFKILCKVIISKKREPDPKTLDVKDFAYLNYWLNSLSKKNTGSYNLTVYKFQDTFSSIEDDFFNYGMLNEKLYDIENEHFNNMNLLSDLYTYHGEIYHKTSNIGDEKIACIGYFEKYINTYKQGIIQCPHDNTSFCEALKHIKEQYQKIFLKEESGVTENCIDRNRLELPTYEDVSRNKQITMVGTVLGPSFGTLFTLLFLYKFTPFGQWILAKIGTKKGAHSYLYEDHDQSFLNSSDNEDINLDYNQYGISYDSVVNS